MRILVAPDKFKGSLAAAEVAIAISAGLRDALPHADITCLPVADGGEGTASVICAAANGAWHSCEVHDPRGRIVTARFCTIDGGMTAVMEMSEAAGLWRVPFAERDPVAASSFGAGEMLLEGAKRGVTRIIIGLGGSATNDGGFGAARALGFRFFDQEERELIGDVSELARLARIRRVESPMLPEIIIAADVTNPLLGRNGATRTFGPQKGANLQQLDLLENALERLAEIVARDLGCDFRETPGSGAAGGLGFGLMSFCAATLRSGFEVVAERIGLESAIDSADVVITGEGRMDAQTLAGKAPAGVAKLARAAGKPVHGIVGSCDQPTLELRELFDSVTTLANAQTSEKEAIANPSQLLRDRARQLAATWS